MFDHGFGGGFMWLFWLLLIIVVLWGAKTMGFSINQPKDTQKSALDILKERYARGEIEREEFEAKKRDLLQ